MRLTLLAGVFAVALAAPVPARAALDPHLPPDTQLYLALDLRKAFDSDLFKKNILGHARDAIKAVESADEALKDLGLDPFKLTFLNQGLAQRLIGVEGKVKLHPKLLA